MNKILLIMIFASFFMALADNRDAGGILLKSWFSLVESPDSLILQFNKESTNPLLKIERLDVPEICEPERVIYLREMEKDRNNTILKHNPGYLKTFEQMSDNIRNCGKPFRMMIDGNLDGKPDAVLSPGKEDCRRPLGASKDDFYLLKNSPFMPVFSRIEYRIDPDIARAVFLKSDLKIFRIIVKPDSDGNLEITLRRHFGHSDEGDIVIHTDFEWDPLP